MKPLRNLEGIYSVSVKYVVSCLSSSLALLRPEACGQFPAEDLELLSKGNLLALCLQEGNVIINLSAQTEMAEYKKTLMF